MRILKEASLRILKEASVRILERPLCPSLRNVLARLDHQLSLLAMSMAPLSDETLGFGIGERWSGMLWAPSKNAGWDTPADDGDVAWCLGGNVARLTILYSDPVVAMSPDDVECRLALQIPGKRHC